MPAVPEIATGRQPLHDLVYVNVVNKRALYLPLARRLIRLGFFFFGKRCILTKLMTGDDVMSAHSAR